MSLFAQIGLLALMGIVMKNGILLIDRANQLREEDVGHTKPCYRLRQNVSVRY